jgi:protein MpaA
VREAFEIGRTFLDRPILAVSFEPASYAKPRPPVLLFGAIHGDEPLGVYCLNKLIVEMCERAPGRPTYVISALNLDGLAAGTKNNARDIDLNRNFAAKNWVKEHKPGYSAGACPESEPETQALVALIKSSGAERLIALHSPYRTVNWDGSGQKLAEEMAARNGYGASADTGYPTPGSFGSKYGVDLGLEVITLEIPWQSEDSAWKENRGALRFAVDLPD